MIGQQPERFACTPNLQYRIPSSTIVPQSLDRISTADAVPALAGFPPNCVSLVVTSPPYWDSIDYGIDGQLGHTEYAEYLAAMRTIWQEAYRVLIPNGKLAIVTPIMPIAKSRIADQHTRHLKNIAFDIEGDILATSAFHRYSLFVWQKQTTTKMFGSYPYPPNIYEDNTLEFINVYVKPGAPPPMPSVAAKESSKLSQREWLNLSMQVWPMYPEDVKRANHPAPFPVVLPLRLIKMYTFAADAERGFGGDIVVDMFAGTGSTLLAAKAAKRRYLGIELNPQYVAIARQRLRTESVDPDAFMLEKPRVRQPVSSRLLGFLDRS